MLYEKRTFHIKGTKRTMEYMVLEGLSDQMAIAMLEDFESVEDESITTKRFQS